MTKLEEAGVIVALVLESALRALPQQAKRVDRGASAVPVAAQVDDVR